MKHLLREPLLHFLVIGAMLFGAYSFINRDVNEKPQAIIISAADISWLKETWARQWVRPPTDLELRGLITDYLKESLLAREALELGLDENDSIVRRRLAQKMDFLVQDTLQQGEPSEQELHSFYEKNREHFQTHARVSFTHVYFNGERRGERAPADAGKALSQLSRPGPAIGASDFGDRFLGQYDFDSVDEQTVANVLGLEFARQVFAFQLETWQGPIESGYGLHLVLVKSKQAARPQDFNAVKNDVLTLWRQQRTQEGLEQYFADLLKKYNVQIDGSVKTLVDPLAVSMGSSK